MGEDFLKEYSEVTKQVKADPANVDLREFIRDELDGCLFSVLFNQQGRAFAGYYYGEGDSPYYPADIDDYALKYFGPSRYHSNEFQQEAYLFIPFDEKYYQTMAQVIEERFENWQGQDFDEDTLEPSGLLRPSWSIWTASVPISHPWQMMTPSCRHTATPSGWGYGRALFPYLSRRMMKRCWNVW